MGTGGEGATGYCSAASGIRKGAGGCVMGGMWSAALFLAHSRGRVGEVLWEWYFLMLWVGGKGM